MKCQKQTLVVVSDRHVSRLAEAPVDRILFALGSQLEAGLEGLLVSESCSFEMGAGLLFFGAVGRVEVYQIRGFGAQVVSG